MFTISNGGLKTQRDNFDLVELAKNAQLRLGKLNFTFAIAKTSPLTCFLNTVVICLCKFRVANTVIKEKTDFTTQEFCDIL